MKKSLRLLSILLSLCLLLAVVPLGTFSVSAATSGICGENLTWAYDDSTYTLTISGTGAMRNYDFETAPWQSYYNTMKTLNIGTGVTTIGEDAFYGCTGLTSITIGNSVTTIGSDAFYGCTGLTSITIPDSVTTIGSEAFSGCTGLTEINWNAKTAADGSSYSGVFYKAGTASGGITVTFGDSVEKIPAYLFYVSDSSDRPNVKSVTIGNSVTTIGGYAFYGCTGLTSITIPNSVTTIGYRAFDGCTGLTGVYITDVAAWCNISFGSYDANPLNYAHNLYLNGELVTDLVIPQGVTEIKEYAFYYCTGLTSITIPDSVTTISSSAFNGCTGLTSVIIGNSVATIGYKAFYSCTGLTSVTIGNGVTTIGNYAFYNCTGLTSITIPDSVTSIGGYAFYSCTGLTSITIPDSVTTIGSDAFYGCTGLTSVIIGNSVTTIGDDAFYYCTGLTKINWNAKAVADFSSSPFYNAGTAGDGITVTFGDSVEKIPAYLFYVSVFSSYSPKVKSVTIGNSVTTIGYRAFDGCTGLTSITIPNSVTTIGDGAFSDCWGLTGVYITDVAAWYNISFGDYDANPLYYAHNLYLNGKLVTDLVIPQGVTTIGGSAFSGCTGLTSITIPNSVTTIGGYAFYRCTGLTSITIPDSVTTIGGDAFQNTTWYNNQPDGMVYAGKVAYKYKGTCPSTVVLRNDTVGIAGSAFYYCTGLMSITIPDSVTSIGDYAFAWCRGLTSITIPNSVTTIGDGAFYFCTGLTSITIPDSVTTIGDYAFGGCTGLTNITIPDSVTTIGDWAFDGCTGLTSITIPDSITSIGSGAFCVCTGLTSINIPDSVTTIGDWAFDGCTGLTSITIGNSVTTIGNFAFYGCTGLSGVYITDVAAWCNISFGNFDSNPLDYAHNLYLNGELVTDLVIPQGVTAIKSRAFYNCTGLTSITIPDSVTTIGSSAFEDCTGLTSITNPNSVTSIGSSAFEDCTRLKNVYYLGSQADWGKIYIGSYNGPLINATRVYNATACDINGHAFGNWIAEIPATCTTDGVKVHCECSVCHKYFDSSKREITNLTISALGHTVSAVQTTNDSNYPFTFSDGVYTSTNHNHSSTSTFTFTATATGTLQLQYGVSSESNYDFLKMFKNGSQIKSVSGSVSWADLSVSVVKGDVVTIQYSKDGSDSSGSDCGYFKIISQIGNVQPTCEAGAYCTVCGEQVIPPNGHTYGNWNTEIPMTCTTDGVKAHYECSTCHKYFDSNENVITDLVIPAHHTETVLKTTAPTCTAQGYDIVKCSACGQRYNSNYTAALGHNYGSWTVTTSASCTEDGVETRYCSRCDATRT
ncbi:MAG: leucine-rich repeat domain-containing protein, partial [Clostridia bacterium]|nr:leucine-rich repeat domain-containing protein [Clostridia bacterium]